MANPKGLFGLKVPAGGAIIPLDTFTDVRITNIAFGEEIKGDARSVVKVHRALIRDDSEYDSLDEDSFDAEGDDSEESKEDDDESDAEDEAKDAVPKLANGINGKKGAKKAAAVAAAAAASSDEDEEGEDSAEGESGEADENDEDSEDEDEHWVEEDFVLCSLYPEKKEQAIVDLAFSGDEEIGFSVSGENAIEITGYYIAPDPFEEMSDSDYDEYDEDDLDSDELDAMYGEVESDSEGGIDSDDEMDEDDIQIEELDEEIKTVPIKKVAATAAKVNTKKRSKEDDEEEIDDAVADAAGDAVKQLTKNQRKKLNKKLKTEAESKDEKAEFAGKETKEDKAKVKVADAKKDTKESAASKKTTLPSGLIIEDKIIGTGPKAKAGNKVGMRYVGRLMNGKQFDANNSGKPFTFKLGKGEVISGWDEGVKGMQVGGQRRLTCPPKLAYGKQGAPPDIPPNSTLVFDVKLVEIK